MLHGEVAAVLPQLDQHRDDDRQEAAAGSHEPERVRTVLGSRQQADIVDVDALVTEHVHEDRCTERDTGIGLQDAQYERQADHDDRRVAHAHGGRAVEAGRDERHLVTDALQNAARVLGPQNHREMDHEPTEQQHVGEEVALAGPQHPQRPPSGPERKSCEAMNRVHDASQTQ